MQGQVYSTENNYVLIKCNHENCYPAIVFNKNYDPHILLENMRERYTPDSMDVSTTERILRDRCAKNKANRPYSNCFCKYKKQLVGFVDQNGARNIVLQLIDYSRPHRTNRVLSKGFEENFVIYLAENPKVKIYVYLINLSTETLSVF